MQYDKVQLFCNHFSLGHLLHLECELCTSKWCICHKSILKTLQHSSITAVREQCCVCVQRGDWRDRDVESGGLCWWSSGKGLVSKYVIKWYQKCSIVMIGQYYARDFRKKVQSSFWILGQCARKWCYRYWSNSHFGHYILHAASWFSTKSLDARQGIPVHWVPCGFTDTLWLYKHFLSCLIFHLSVVSYQILKLLSVFHKLTLTLFFVNQ